MADFKLLNQEINDRGIPCSIIRNDERGYDELSFAGIVLERMSGNKPVEDFDRTRVIRESEAEICNFYGIKSPIMRSDVYEITETETEIAENIFDIFERHAFNRGLKIKSPGTTL